jgi:NTE family protein
MFDFKAYPFPASGPLAQVQVVINFFCQRATDSAHLDEIVNARTAQSINTEASPQNLYLLGGLFNMSGFGQNRLAGRQLVFGMLQYQRRLTGQTLIPLSSPVYAGISLEQGNLWASRNDIALDDLRSAGSVYLGIDSPLGPVYIAYGRAEGVSQSIYLSLGWPFYSQDHMRR